LDKRTSEYFNDVIKKAQISFENIEYNSDFTPEQAILNLQCTYGLHKIFITELFSDGIRKYRYYVLHVKNKTQTILTEDINFSDFIKWLKLNIQREKETDK